jgi:FkbM family methyltransferase
MDKNLIYDVGLNNGDDTAHYLFKGFRVVAIEANSILIEAARHRFAKEIADGRLELVNVAIAPERGRAEFWICEQRSEWSSLNKANATKQGTTAYAVQVDCAPFREILGTYDVPYYLKVDIEGHDRFCIVALERSDLPKYVSLEAGKDIVEPMLCLRRLGYDRFKIIRQRDHSQLTATPQSRIRRLARLIASAIPKRQRAKAADRTWTFPFGSSGPFGEETAGNWQTLEEALHTWLHWRLGHGPEGIRGTTVWADVHASRSSA